MAPMSRCGGRLIWCSGVINGVVNSPLLSTWWLISHQCPLTT